MVGLCGYQFVLCLEGWASPLDLVVTQEGRSEDFPTVYVILLSVERLKIIVGVRLCSINCLFVLSLPMKFHLCLD